MPLEYVDFEEVPFAINRKADKMFRVEADKSLTPIPWSSRFSCMSSEISEAEAFETAKDWLDA